ncbi:MAG: hypothetical protein H6744_00540 [Deltaproteobacteria bacterium]|nr:hypothetical protein [Deltaproteobacteria bacterium]MCB9785153.1 hypothetical protein [Deltaproteobacteria bacterium]
MDDQLLEALGQRAARRREQVGALDERWLALAEGRLDEAESERARQEDPARWAAFAPLDEAAQERVHREVARALDGAAAGEGGAPVIALAPRRKARWARLAMVVAPLAAAAALVLVLRGPLGGTDGPPLPGYGLEVSGGLATVRGAEAPEPSRRFTPDSPVELLLRPQQAAQGPVAVRAWRRMPGQAWQAWDAPAQISAEGSARIAGSAAELLGTTPGVVGLRIVVGRPDELPGGPEAQGDGGDAWQRFDMELELIAPR